MKLLTFIIFLALSISAKAQQNLVPNPSFEDYVTCPLYLDNMPDVQSWSSFRNSPDYFNGCSTGGMNVPYAAFGYQSAHSGSAFTGMATYFKGNSTLGNNYREFIGVTLIAQLNVGIKYFFSFYVVSAQNNSVGFFSNNIGIRFCTTTYSVTNPAPLDNFSHLKSDSIITDTINWQKVSGSFIADSNYQYLIVGNFYDYLNIDTLAFNAFPQGSYYYIDDICVTIDSLYNETWTGINNIQKEEVSLWPNPASDFFEFKAMQVIEEISVYDFSGRLVRSEKINADNGRINLSGLPTGVYLATFRKEGYISSYRFSKY